MFYNKEATEFVCKTLSSTNFLTTVDLYLNSWRDREREKDKCSFCSFVFHRKNPEETKYTIEQIRQFATRMPISCTGTVFVWYYTMKKFGLSVCAANSIDPESVFLHLIVRTCNNDIISHTPLTERIPKMLELHTLIKEQQLKPFETDDESSETECEKPGADTSIKLAKKLRVNYEMMLENLKKGGCYGYNKDKQSRCIYSNTGSYDTAAMNHALNTDARTLVSPSWVEKHLPEVPLEEFYGEDSYALYQPSMKRQTKDVDTPVEMEFCADEWLSLPHPPAKKHKPHGHANSGNNNNNNKNQACEITPFFAVEGDLKQHQLSTTDQYEEQERSKFFWERYFDHASAVKVEIDVLCELHRCCYNSEIRGTRKLRLGLRSHPCVWCTVCISPAARRILYDLISMAREQVRVLGMKVEATSGSLMTGDDALASKFYFGTANECEEETTKNAVSEHEKRRKGRRGAPCTRPATTRHPDVLYTMDFEESRVQCEPISCVFKEWAEEKYPFMHTVLTGMRIYQKQNELEDAIRQHCTSDGNVFCICNMRRMFSDADCCMRTNHVCLLPFLFHGAETLVQLLGEEKCLKILKGRTSCLIARHHMSPRME